MFPIGKSLFIVLISVLTWGCSKRDRLNPLDPLNPDTIGKPVGVSVTSEKNDVTLSWIGYSMDDIKGYNIYRRRDGESFEKVGFVFKPAESFIDYNQEYDRMVTYRISVITDDYESPLSDSVSIIPGPDNYWMTDLYGGMVAKLTYDTKHFITYTLTLPRPLAVLPDSVSGGVWVLDALGFLYRLSEDAEIITWIDGLVDPGHITGNLLQNNLWISNFSGTQVRRYDSTGFLMGTISGFHEISGIAWADVLESCWVADRKAKNIQLYSLDGNLQVEIDSTMNVPSAISYYQNGSWLWVADSTNLKRVWPDGRVENILDVEIPIRALSVDQNSGDCWMIREPIDWQSDLLKVTPEGNIRVTVNGFYSAQAVQANHFNGGCLVADTGNGRIVRISSDGDILSILEGFISPWDIAVE